MQELLPLHEAWADWPLVPSIAYGLRVYRNGSSLNMHVDRRETHIISSILHIDHDEYEEDNKGWPIVIEDFQGNTNEVYLESGDMLIYESSKCFHGRPVKFKGAWYSSLFLHYYPVEWDAKQVTDNVHYRIPPSWIAREENNRTVKEQELAIVSTSFKEPNCEHQWCMMTEAIKWYGPAPAYGKVLSTGGKNSSLLDILGTSDRNEF